MTGYGPFTPADESAVTEHLIAWLLSEGPSAAIPITTEELTDLKMQNDTLRKDGQVLDFPVILTVYLTAGISTIGTEAMVQGGGDIEMEYVALMDGFMDNQLR